MEAPQYYVIIFSPFSNPYFNLSRFDSGFNPFLEGLKTNTSEYALIYSQGRTANVTKPTP